jgi:hypothetical protein
MGVNGDPAGDLLDELLSDLPIPKGDNGPSPNGVNGKIAGDLLDELLSDPPAPNGDNGPSTNGRNAITGQFVKGNAFARGRGNPEAARVAELRGAFLRCATEEDVEAVTRKLVRMAKGGNIHAIREFNDRVFGKAERCVGNSVEQRRLFAVALAGVQDGAPPPA